MPITCTKTATWGGIESNSDRFWEWWQSSEPLLAQIDGTRTERHVCGTHPLTKSILTLRTALQFDWPSKNLLNQCETT